MPTMADQRGAGRGRQHHGELLELENCAAWWVQHVWTEVEKTKLVESI